MAKRAIERLDETLAGRTVLVLDGVQRAALLAALERRDDAGDAALREICDRLRG
ncbi:MAG: hypothetical protein NVS3B28_30960 [Candidatus Velthaea sp.]